jgi:UDP-glucose:(heptosyl)LPS alpha-1,3-glucosyltransferase
MRIGIAYLEYSRSKGIERIAADLADRIARRGHEVHFHCTKWEDAAGSLVQFHKVRTLDIVNSSKLLSFAVLGRAGLNRGHYDIAHSYGNVVGCDVITAQSCHLAGMKIARTVFKNRIKSGVNYGVADRLRLYLERENYGGRRYKKVIACSNLVKRELMAYYHVPDSDVAVIPNGVDTGEFHPNNREVFSEQVRSAHGIGREDLVLLFVGHEFVRKGLQTVMESLAILNDKRLKLLICGGDHFEPFYQQAKSLGIEPQVIFLGAQHDVKKYYSAADIFVLPTFHDAFGLVITEAMASGLPVIVSKNAGAAEDIIEDGKDGVLISDPQNAKELATKIRALVQSPSMREKIGAQARQKVAIYTWEECAERVLQVYEEVRHEKLS